MPLEGNFAWGGITTQIQVHFLEPKKWEELEREGNDHSLWEAQGWENGLEMVPVQPTLEPQPHRRGSEWRGHAPTHLPGSRKELALGDREFPCRLTHSLAQG